MADLAKEEVPGEEEPKKGGEGPQLVMNCQRVQWRTGTDSISRHHVALYSCNRISVEKVACTRCYFQSQLCMIGHT